MFRGDRLYEDDKESILTGRQNEGVACNETIRQQACVFRERSVYSELGLIKVSISY